MMYRRRRRSYGFMFMIWREKKEGGASPRAGARASSTPPGAAAPAPPHLLEGVLEERLPGNADLHVAGQRVRLRARQRHGALCRLARRLPHLRLPTASGCPGTQPAPRLRSPRAAGLRYSHGRGSGTGGTSNESSGRTPPGSPPACSCKSSTGLGSASCPPSLAPAARPQQPHHLPGSRKISGHSPAPPEPNARP